MTNETNQKERNWKVQRSTENIWKIQDALESKLKYQISVSELRTRLSLSATEKSACLQVYS